MKQFLSLSIVLLTLLLPGTAAADGWVNDTINGVVYTIHYTGERSSAVGTDATVYAQEDFILSGSVSIQSTATRTIYWYERDGYGNNVLRSKSITAPVTGIYGFARSNITDIYLPESITSIGYNAFEGCNSLTHITMPESITYIGSSAFEGCSSLTHITIPESITSIGTNTFKGCSSLTHITIPESITSIGYNAFEGCNGLTHITMPESITSIGYNAFEGCNSLTHITIPSSVVSIGAQAFLNCENLTTVTWNARNCGEPWQRHLYEPNNDGLWSGSPIKRIIIGEEVESIGNHVFDSILGEWGVTGLEQIICKAIIPPTIYEQTFFFNNYYYYENPFSSLSVPAQSLQAYKNAPYWKDYFFNNRAIGDANDDGNVNIADVTELIEIMLSMNTPENNYADIDGDGRVNIGDVTELINIILKGY